MADNDNKVDESPVEEQPVEEQVQPEAPQVELDKATGVEGDLVENPKLEEVEEENVDEPVNPEDLPADDEPDAGVEEPVGEGEPGAEVQQTEAEESGKEPEPDEAGVYEAPKTPDPGTFQPKGDYSFEVTTTDGKTVKINTQAEAEAFAQRIDENPELVSASQFTKFNRGITKMDIGLDQEQTDFLKQKDQFELEQRQEQVRNDQIVQWNNEINYLQSKGLIPEISSSANADWTGNANDPAVKSRMEIFNWMDKENAARREAGIPEVTSAVDAFTMMRAEQQETAAKEEAVADKQNRQRRGSMIRGNAPYSPDNTPNNSIIGTGGTLRELELEAQQNL